MLALASAVCLRVSQPLWCGRLPYEATTRYINEAHMTSADQQQLDLNYMRNETAKKKSGRLWLLENLPRYR
jgi:hypothetical protein